MLQLVDAAILKSLVSKKGIESVEQRFQEKEISDATNRLSRDKLIICNGIVLPPQATDSPCLLSVTVNIQYSITESGRNALKKHNAARRITALKRWGTHLLSALTGAILTVLVQALFRY